MVPVDAPPVAEEAPALLDRDDVAEGRMGVRESIRARMERYGGNATIRSELGEGTNVRLEMSG